jgi:hypothetical protein|uniref:Uncharacterized protein n=1 Tax=Sipha flava TaxID=143950 RepID=A0A2S2QQQ2_9HEMI
MVPSRQWMSVATKGLVINVPSGGGREGCAISDNISTLSGRRYTGASTFPGRPRIWRSGVQCRWEGRVMYVLFIQMLHETRIFMYPGGKCIQYTCVQGTFSPWRQQCQNNGVILFGWCNKSRSGSPLFYIFSLTCESLMLDRR